MKKLISKKLIPFYFALAVVARFIFKLVNEKVLIKPFDLIDTRAGKFFMKPFCHTCLFDAAYVREAKDHGYNISNYLKFYLPLDTIFPIIYSLLFLSIIQLLPLRAKGFRKWITLTVIAGGLFDWSENFSFAFYLKNDVGSFASIVSFFTTLKTFFIIFNALACIIIILLSFIKHKTWRAMDASQVSD